MAINITKEDFAKKVMELTDGKGVPVVYDGIGVLFDAALGSSSSSGGADPYTHTYVPAFDLPS